MLSGRIERRMSLSIIACLETPDAAASPETVTLENISEHGARVLSGRQWTPKDRVIVSDLFGDFHVGAEVVYSQRTGDGLYAIGLRFEAAGMELAHGIPLEEK